GPSTMHETFTSESSEPVVSARRPPDSTWIVGPDDPILITGATGFIGARLVNRLLELGFCNLICFVRPSGKMGRPYEALQRYRSESRVKVIQGNLQSPDD